MSALWQRARRKKTVLFSLGVLLALGLIALLAPWLAPHDPYEWSITQSSLPPAWVHNLNPPGTAEFPLGTDRFGRDILSRMLYGTSTAFALSLSAVSAAALLGVLAGALAAYAGGKLDALILLLIDIFQAVPGIMLVVIVVLILRSQSAPSWLQGVITLTAAFALSSWAGLARLVRVSAMQVKSRQFVEAVIALGASPFEIIARHILPNIRFIILVWIVNNIPAIILLEAVLGYIGVGVTSAVDGGEFTAISWGGMFFAGRSAMMRNPLMLIIPSLCILLLSMSLILLADFLGEAGRRDQE